MKIAYILFDKLTYLDFVGVYDPVSRLKSQEIIPELNWDICSFTNLVSDEFGLQIIPNKIKNNLSEYDAIIIPGGIGTRELQVNRDFLKWIKTSENVKYKILVCTGSLILGAAGFLQNKSATTHYNEYHSLEKYCNKVSFRTIEDDENTITAGAVAASLELGLYLCEKWAGKKAAQEIRNKMNYK